MSGSPPPDDGAEASSPSETPRAPLVPHPSQPSRASSFLRAAVFLLPATYITLLDDSLVLHWMGPDASVINALTISRGVSAVLLLALSALCLAAFDRRSFRILGLWRYRGWFGELVRGILIGGVLMAIAVVLLIASRRVLYGAYFDGSARVLIMVLRCALMFFFAAALEEIQFRGYGFQRLVDAIGAVGATVLLSVAFACAHLFNPSVTLLSTLNTALAGVLLSVAYLKTRALWLPIGLHWAWNFFQAEIFSLPVSGIRFGRAFMSPVILGPRWWTGGVYGPEGGLAITTALVCGILWLARTKRIAPSPAMEEVLQ